MIRSLRFIFRLIAFLSGVAKLVITSSIWITKANIQNHMGIRGVVLGNLDNRDAACHAMQVATKQLLYLEFPKLLAELLYTILRISWFYEGLKLAEIEDGDFDDYI